MIQTDPKRSHGGWREPRRRLGPGYTVRVLLLFAATAALTWYAGQDSNNPFARSPHICVSADSSWYFIRTARRNDRSGQTYVLLMKKRNYSEAGRCMQIPGSWTLLTTAYIGGLDTCFANPPSQWYVVQPHGVIDTSVHDSAYGRLRPSIITDAVGAPGLDCSLIPVFGDEQKMLLLTYGNMKLIVLDGASLPDDTAKHSRFREMFDIAVALGYGENETVRIRDLLRPAYLVSIRTTAYAQTIASRENILYPSGGTFSYDFTKNNRHRVQYRQDYIPRKKILFLWVRRRK